MIKKSRDIRVRRRAYLKHVRHVYNALNIDLMLYGTCMSYIKDGRVVPLDPLSHRVKDGILYCENPEKCGHSTDEIKDLQNFILK